MNESFSQLVWAQREEWGEKTCQQAGLGFWCWSSAPFTEMQCFALLILVLQ